MKVSKRTSAWSKAVKKRLIDLDMSIYDLADKLEMSRVYVSSVVNGRVISPNAIKKISYALGLDTEYDEEE